MVRGSRPITVNWVVSSTTISPIGISDPVKTYEPGEPDHVIVPPTPAEPVTKSMYVPAHAGVREITTGVSASS
jgi:hypothetical protein